MAYDYTGYGKSTGRPAEEQCYADIEAAFQHLTEQLGQSPEKIVLYVAFFSVSQHMHSTYHRYGRSLGSGPTCYLAQKQSREQRPVAGVILQVVLPLLPPVINVCSAVVQLLRRVRYSPCIESRSTSASHSLGTCSLM